MYVYVYFLTVCYYIANRQSEVYREVTIGAPGIFKFIFI